LKNRHILATVSPIAKKFVKVTKFDPLDRADRQNLEILKIQDGGGRQCEKKIEKSPV